MKPAFYDLRQRRPVWEALSDLFLDTDVTRTRRWRVRTLAASPYSVAELEQILIDEVYPICHVNLWSVAGVWAGFDQYWWNVRSSAACVRRCGCYMGSTWGGSPSHAHPNGV